jgi:protein-arginine kinase activator protein McsA
MKRLFLFIFLSGFLLLVTSSVMAQEGVDQLAQQTPQVNSIIAEEGKQSFPQKYIDERILAVEKDAQDKINTIVEEINGLTDCGKEPELQKQIEKIKLDAEVARLKIELEIAEEEGNVDVAQKLRDEINHLENLDNPVVGFPEEQPAP